MSSWRSGLFLFLLMLCGIFLFFLPTLYSNLARVIVQNSLWQEGQPAADRQHALHLASQLLVLAVGDDEPQDLAESGMIPAIYRAESYRRLGDLKLTAVWLEKAATAQPYPAAQRALIFGATTQIGLGGDIMINASTPGWKVRRDSPAKAIVQYGAQGGEDQVITFSWESEEGHRNRGSYVWAHPFEIPYNHHVILMVKIQPQCVLLFETSLDGNLVRHLQVAGSGEWEKVETIVKGDQLGAMYLHLDSEVEGRTGCQAELRSIAFVFDSDINGEQ